MWPSSSSPLSAPSGNRGAGSHHSVPWETAYAYVLQDAAPLLQWPRCGELSHLSAGGDAMHSVCGWVSFFSLAPSLASFSWSGPWASLHDGLVPPWDSVSYLNLCLVVSVPFLWFLSFLTSLSSHPLSMSSCLSWSNCSQPGCHSHRWPLLWQTLL